MGQKCSSNKRNTSIPTRLFSSKLKARNSDSSDSTTCGRNDTLCVHPGMYIGNRNSDFNDHYIPSRILGSGAYGNVYLCTQIATGSERAVKVVDKTNITIESLEEKRLLKEVHYLKQLDHPNIARLHNFYEDSKAYYIVMDACYGGELFDEIISRQRFSECDSASLMKQILSGVCYLHKRNIVHRDLKPENILFETKERDSLIKIVDFGLSTHLTGYSLRERLGTAYYIAPEVLKKQYNEKCDIWSCGVILYILLCGYPPFGGSTDAAIIAKVESGKYRFPSREWSSISDEAIDLIRQMLTFDPQQRITAQEALQHPWISKANQPTIDVKCQSLALRNLRNFQKTQKLAESAILLMATRLTSAEETKELTRLFAELDINGDGHLEREELIQGYYKLMQAKHCVFMESSDIEKEVDEILAAVDFDNNGYIDYSEFVAGCMDKKKLLSEQHLRIAFETFDYDGSGSISKAELADIFGLADMTDDTYIALLGDIDANADGEVNFEEFVAMIKKICA
ncbi:bifunctional EF-hand domain/EF-Hand 1 [Babesia duncani]|uniref:Calcium-dependent protein kinase 1 n=1 Tax=Babesia duncani TaxID=323732 RepID=A0AAD9PLS2_9APIC|nr:bifunctional EF-hand domain/EF-Hand 1 [Babesia duncani]